MSSNMTEYPQLNWVRTRHLWQYWHEKITSTLYNNMETLDNELDADNITYIIDYGFVLHSVVWSKDPSFVVLINLSNTLWFKNNQIQHGYSNYCKNINESNNKNHITFLLMRQWLCLANRLKKEKLETVVHPQTNSRWCSYRRQSCWVLNIKRKPPL